MMKSLVNNLAIAALIASMPYQAIAKTYSEPGTGVSIEIDDYFSQEYQADGVKYFISADSSAAVVIKTLPSLTHQQINMLSTQGYQDMNMSVTVSNEASNTEVTEGSGMTVDVDGILAYQNIQGKLGAFVGDSGKGLVMLIASLPEGWSNIQLRSDAIFHSIHFTEQTSTPSNGSIEATWKQRLSGKYIKKPDSSTYGSSSSSYNLCSDGSFSEYSSMSNYTSDYDTGGNVSVYAGSNSSNIGQWDVKLISGQPHVYLNYGDEQGYALLEDRGGYTYIGGSHYYVVDSDQCQ